MQAVDPESDAKLPAPHMEHVVRPNVAPNVPAAQEAHSLAPAPEYCPKAHGLQDVEAIALRVDENMPALQLVHKDVPVVAAKLPSGQLRQDEALTVENLPNEQLKQADAPVALW